MITASVMKELTDCETRLFTQTSERKIECIASVFIEKLFSLVNNTFDKNHISILWLKILLILR